MNRHAIERLADEFDGAWRKDGRPELLVFLQRVPPSLRKELARVLIPIDIEYLRQSGGRPEPGDYQALGMEYARIAEEFLLPGQRQPATDEGGIPTAVAGLANQAGELEGRWDVRVDQPSQMVGNYKLLQQLGEGGMGTVWMADQVHPVRRRVALKLIKSGMDNSQIIARFEAERQALALMDHPNIARVYDAGITPDGRPFFAMELVRGVPVTEYCDTHRLALKDRLDLVVQACRALQHAHQKGIIHRDVKPSNLLVTLQDNRPVAKVIDFGLAKALHDQSQLTDRTLFTRHGQVVGTLEYMSPEQAASNSMDVDTRTDVYSLGVILYELLTGSTPIGRDRLRSEALDRILRLIREEEVARPSSRLSQSGASGEAVSVNRRTDVRRLSLLLRRDLDWIAVKALEKDRTRRYEGAAALADDIQRYLGNEPILARPPSFRYRLGKAWRRHWASFVTAGAVLAALLAGLVGTGAMWWRARNAEIQAQEKTREVEAALLQSRLAGNEASAARDLEAAARKREQESHAQLVQALERNEVTVSRSHYLLAGLKFRDREVHEAQSLLDSIQQKYRNFEWYLDRSLFSQSLRTLAGHTSAVQAVAWSPDGIRIVSCENDGTVLVAESDTGKQLWKVTGESVCWEACFSPDGERIALACKDGKLRIHQAANGQLVESIDSGQSGLHWIGYSPDGSRIATAGADPVKLWNSSTGELVASLAGHEGQVYSAGFSNDGTHLVTGSGRTIRVWNLESGTTIQTVELDQEDAEDGPTIFFVAMSPTENRVASASNSGAVQIWDLETGDEVGNLRGHDGPVMSLAWSPDGSHLATAGGDGTIRIGKPDDEPGEAEEKIQVLAEHSDTVSSIRFSPDGAKLVSGSWDGTVKVWPAVPIQAARPQALTEHFHAVDFSADGKWFAAAVGKEVLVRPFSPEVVPAVTAPEQGLIRFTGHTDVIFDIKFSPDGTLIASSASEGVVLLWRVADGTVVHALEGHQGAVRAIAFSTNGEFIVSGSSDGTVRRWETATGKLVATWPQHRTTVSDVLVGPGDQWVASGSTDKTIKVVDVENGSDLHLLETGHVVHCLALDPGKRWLAAGCDDNVVRLYDCRTFEEVGTLRGHRGAVGEVTFSPDGTRVVSGDLKGEIRIWDPVSQECLREIAAHREYVSVLRFSPDGTLLVSGACEESVRVWESRPGGRANESQRYWLAGSQLPRTGAADDRYLAFDQFMEGFLRENQLPGATLAVACDGRMVYSRGFGYSDFENRIPMEPDAVMRIASLSKPVTSAAIMRLVEEGLVGLDDPVVQHLPLELLPPQGTGDQRLGQVTVRHCLQHTGGWNRELDQDPMFNPRLARESARAEYGTSANSIVKWMLGRQLDHAPGTVFAYSNFGYCLLGRIIEHRAGLAYEEHVRREILEPLGLGSMRIGSSRLDGRTAGEPVYYTPDSARAQSVFDPAAGLVPVQYGGWNLANLDSHGGWLASAPDVLRLATAFDNPEQSGLMSVESLRATFARPPGKVWRLENGVFRDHFYASGWFVRPVEDGLSTWHFGYLEGSGSLVVRRFDGVTWVVLFNQGLCGDGEFSAVKADQQLHKPANTVFADTESEERLAARAIRSEITGDWENAARFWRRVLELRSSASQTPRRDALTRAAIVSLASALRGLGKPEEEIWDLLEQHSDIDGTKLEFQIAGFAQDEYQRLVNRVCELEGFVITTATIDTSTGERIVSATFAKNRPRRFENWEARSVLTAAEFASRDANNRTMGMKLVHHQIYTFEGTENHAAVWLHDTGTEIAALLEQLEKAAPADEWRIRNELRDCYFMTGDTRQMMDQIERQLQIAPLDSYTLNCLLGHGHDSNPELAQQKIRLSLAENAGRKFISAALRIHAADLAEDREFAAGQLRLVSESPDKELSAYQKLAAERLSRLAGAAVRDP